MAEQADRRGHVYHGIPDRLMPTTLVRNHDMVHRRWCYRVKGREVTAWSWAEGKSADEVAEAKANGLKFCRACKPLEHIPQTSSNR